MSRLGEHQQMTTTRKRRIIRIPVPVTDSGSHLSKASKPSPQPGKCAKNHTLRRASAEEGLSCDACNRALHCGDTIWCCKPCDYDQCSGCTRAAVDSSLHSSQHTEAVTAEGTAAAAAAAAAAEAAGCGEEERNKRGSELGEKPLAVGLHGLTRKQACGSRLTVFYDEDGSSVPYGGVVESVDAKRGTCFVSMCM